MFFLINPLKSTSCKSADFGFLTTDGHEIYTDKFDSIAHFLQELK
jgi:hypothetical protein